MPGIISPVKLDGKWLLDGGMTNPVPVSACRAMGAEIVIAINPNAHSMEPHARRDITKAASNDSVAPSRDFLDKLLDSVPDGIKQSLNTVTLNLFGSKSGAPGYFDVLSTSLDIMTSQILRSQIAGEPPHVMVRPRLAYMAVLEFNRAKEAVDEGRRAMQEMMPMLRILAVSVPWAPPRLRRTIQAKDFAIESTIVLIDLSCWVIGGIFRLISRS